MGAEYTVNIGYTWKNSLSKVPVRTYVQWATRTGQLELTSLHLLDSPTSQSLWTVSLGMIFSSRVSCRLHRILAV
jgi:hypothetical protein